MSPINPNDPAYWAALQARVLTQKIAAATKASVSAFVEEQGKMKPGMIYETYVLDTASLAEQKYADLQAEIGKPQAFTPEVKRAFMETCAVAIGMPEILEPRGSLIAEARQAQSDASSSLYGEDGGHDNSDYEFDFDEVGEQYPEGFDPDAEDLDETRLG